MKESINGAWLLGLLLTFMAVFIGFIAITINYGNAFEMKTKMVESIEKSNGMNTSAMSKINSIMSSYGYRIKAKCPKVGTSAYYGITDNRITQNPTTPQSYCVYKSMRPATSGSETKYYYQVYVFFSFSLPVLGDIFTFKINGETNVMYYPVDDAQFRF